MGLVAARIRRACAFLTVLFASAAPIYAQSSTATLSGVVIDESNAVIPGVAVTILAKSTGFQREAKTGDEGQFTFASLQPGRYSVRAERQGFTPVQVPDLTLNVNDNVSIRLQLKVEKINGETVTVVAEPTRRSTSPAVSTVIDRQFVENLPLNGRSLQSLLELTPGVVLSGGSNFDGQFSVNGQRTNANYITVDGVSANAGMNSGPTSTASQAASGQLPAMTTLGGTNGLVTVDALQEFRIQTSTYAPEFGRMPGGQVSMVTRSGTNAFHGSLFEFFRDDTMMQANDWFLNSRGQAKPELRQNNFGGVIGGPVRRDTTFFFLSYEGLRLRQPQGRLLTVVSLSARRAARPEFQPYLNAIPLPTGRDLNADSAEFVASWSDPSSFDATSLRIDQRWGALNVFGRGSHTPSESTTRNLATLQTTHQRNTSITTGATWIPSRRTVHDLRVNYTRNSAPFTVEVDDFGGAVAPPESVFGPFFRKESATFFLAAVGGGQWSWGTGSNMLQRQFNVLHNMTTTMNSHEVKVGVDYRRVNPLIKRDDSPSGFQTLVLDTNLSLPRARSYQTYLETPGRRAVAFDNLALFAQDTWRMASRLTLTYGLRWEVMFPPRSTEGPSALTLDNLDDPYGGQVRFASIGTPLWNTKYNNFAPRVGASYALSDRPGRQSVLKGGFGVFHDLGYGQIGSAFTSYPFVLNRSVVTPVFPLTPEVLALPLPDSTAPTSFWAADRNLTTPYTYQWSVSFERAVGPYQSLTVAYVGSAGRKLLKNDGYNIRLVDWPLTPISLSTQRNRGYSDYGALQVKFQRRLHAGLQAQASYTLGRSRDTASSDLTNAVPAEKLPPELDYGYSDYDVRDLFTAAATYETSRNTSPSLLRAVIRNWGFDLIGRARSGSPIDITTTVPFPPDNQSVRPNVVPNQPFWIEDPTAPRGRRLNRNAFSTPAPNTQGDLPRGLLRGFSAYQLDFAVRRELRLVSEARFQFRFEIFNLFNTPNFGLPNGRMSSATFGQSTAMLNRSLGGLNSLYQIGGPRSSQLALKFLF